MKYNQKLDEQTQISLEEEISSMIFDNENIVCSEETSAQLSRNILKYVLGKFRPDLFDS